MIFVTSVPWLLRMSLIVMALFRNLYYTTESVSYTHLTLPTILLV